MDNSILYGLRNPAMTDDIGMTMIERQFPTPIGPTSYVPADGNVPQINNGQPNSDIYQTKKEKEYSTIKKILLALGAIGLGIFGFKKGAKWVSKSYNYIKTNSGSLITKCKDFVKNTYSKIKTKISP